MTSNVQMALGMPNDAGANFSPSRRYRYSLWRRWSKLTPAMVVIGLNPSTADETEDDPTIRRCVGFARREGCGGLVMLNLFAFRTTQPDDLKKVGDPVGADNGLALLHWTRARGVRMDTEFDTAPKVSVVVAAWGVHGSWMDRERIVVEELRAFEHASVPLMCFGTTKGGYPKHPLYLPLDAPLVPYVGRSDAGAP